MKHCKGLGRGQRGGGVNSLFLTYVADVDTTGIIAGHTVASTSRDGVLVVLLVASQSPDEGGRVIRVGVGKDSTVHFTNVAAGLQVWHIGSVVGLISRLGRIAGDEGGNTEEDCCAKESLHRFDGNECVSKRCR